MALWRRISNWFLWLYSCLHRSQKTGQAKNKSNHSIPLPLTSQCLPPILSKPSIWLDPSHTTLSFLILLFPNPPCTLGTSVGALQQNVLQRCSLQVFSLRSCIMWRAKCTQLIPPHCAQLCPCLLRHPPHQNPISTSQPILIEFSTLNASIVLGINWYLTGSFCLIIMPPFPEHNVFMKKDLSHTTSYSFPYSQSIE